jgi:hypothetical protein
MRARFTDSISSAEGWAYGVGTVVTVGSVFTNEEVPEAQARQWLASGLLVAVPSANAERATHPKRR